MASQGKQAGIIESRKFSRNGTNLISYLDFTGKFNVIMIITNYDLLITSHKLVNSN
jgi:hypothetical protein